LLALPFEAPIARAVLTPESPDDRPATIPPASPLAFVYA